MRLCAGSAESGDCAKGQSPRGMCNAIVTYDAQLIREAAMQLDRRKFLHLAAGATAASATSRVARAQAYPSRPITLIVPIAAGGGLDTGAHSQRKTAGKAAAAFDRGKSTGCRFY